MSAADLITDVELAAEFQMSVTRLHRLRRAHNWPFVRFSRIDIRFTRGQVEEILNIQSSTKHADDVAAKSKGKTKQVSGLPGQTSRSAQRASA